MDKFRVQGPTKLQDEVVIFGVKNATLPILFATLLTEEPVGTQSVPKLKDVDMSMELLSQLDAKAECSGSVHIDARDVNAPYTPYDLARATRASIWALEPPVARSGRGQVSLSGGHTIGVRPVDPYISGLEQLGATVKLEEGYIKALVDGRLKGAYIVMDKVSVSATVTTTCVTTLAEGITITESVACELGIVDTANFLITLGAKISGQGTDRIIIGGVGCLGGGVYCVLPDRIETSTFLVAAAISRSRVICRNAQPDTPGAVLAKLRDTGADIEVSEDWINLDMHGKRLKAANVRTAPYPTLPTDIQVQFMLLNLVVGGTGFITEMVPENRFTHTPKLSRMGAHAEIGSNAVICHGVEKLSDTQVMAASLRASASLILTGYIAEGTTVVDHIHHIDRDYGRIEDKLRALSANIEYMKSE